MNRDDELLLIDFFAALSEVLTPESNSLFVFLSKSIMFDANNNRLIMDYSATCISGEALENKVAIRSRHPIVDDPDMNDLGSVSICFESDFNNISSMCLDFYSPVFDVGSSDLCNYKYTYVVDLMNKTLTLISGAE